MPKVTDNRAEQEYEIEVDGYRAVAAYQLEDGVMTFTHTVVPAKIEGRGVASTLIRGALDDARDRALRVVAQCTFVRAYIERHPEYRDLLR